MRRFRLQYSLKTFLLFSALLAFPLGFLAWPFRLWYAEQRAIEQILSQGGAVYDQSQSLKSWDWQALWYGKPGRRFEVRFSGPELAQADLSALPRLAGLRGLTLNDSPLPPGALPILAELTRLERLDVNRTDLDDQGLVAMRDLTDLKPLELYGTKVTEGGLVHLARLQQLELLEIGHLQLTNQGLSRLAPLTRLYGRLRLGDWVTDAGMPGLAGMTQLTDLDLGMTHVTDQGLAALAGMHDLRRLNLNRNVGDAGLAHLKNLTDLASLSAGSPQTTNAGLASLARMTKLQDLRLRQSFVDGAGLAHLVGMQDLRVLDLSQCPVDDDAVVQLVRQHPRLERLDLGYTRVTGTALPAIAQLKNLRHLNLSRTPVTVAALKTLGPDSPITWLDLYGTRVGDDLVEILASIPNLQILEVYDAPRLTAGGIGLLKGRVPNLKYDASRVSALTAAVANPPIPRVEDRRAEVSGPQFDAAALQAFQLPAEVDTLRISYTWGSDEDVRSVARFPQIEQLSVWSNGLTDAALGRLHEFPRLRHFDLSHEWIGRAGIEEIARQTSLESLMLRDLPILDADLAPLARLHQLRELRLSGNWLRGAFLANLENSPIVVLQIDCPNLDERNLEHLAKMPALDSVYLSHCPITDVGAKALSRLVPVRVLRVDGSLLTDAAREELRRRVPGVVFADEDASP